MIKTKIIRLSSENHEIRLSVIISGIVQGVGFRPFIFNLAKKLNIAGYVQNQNGQVCLEVESLRDSIITFFELLEKDLPKLARIDQYQFNQLPLTGRGDFKILESNTQLSKIKLLPPDVMTCEECARELQDKTNPRFQYPFINCIHCGPRFSIIKSFPYDRSQTTMDKFNLCSFCNSEYENPSNRRYHAQPIACPECGPKLKLVGLKREDTLERPLKSACELLDEGKILAIKGIGSYHYVCDAFNLNSVKQLRENKKRDEKPFALMARDCNVIKDYCQLSKNEEIALLSKEAPIVLLRKKENDFFSTIAPNNSSLAFMLPGNPLHSLLFHFLKTDILVMTSANKTSEPGVYEDSELRENFDGIVDYILTHDRPIHTRLDDSLLKIENENIYMIRRSRGFAPLPLKKDHYQEILNKKNILAMGGQLKNTFSINKNNYIYLSQHIGDLFYLKSFQDYKNLLSFYQTNFDLKPELIACDYHEGYYPTQLALEQSDLPVIKVQHHHAHLASCMVENNLTEPAIGVCFDGAGLGTDHTIWGGEFLIGDFKDFKRVGSFSSFPLISGENSYKEIWKIALGIIHQFGLKYRPEHWEQNLIEPLSKLSENSIHCSSVGKLFDAAAALIGGQMESSFEAQAPLYLENLALQMEHDDYYCLNINFKNNLNEISTNDLFAGIIQDLQSNYSLEYMARKFHNSIIQSSFELLLQLRDQYKINSIVLSGGVFLNSIVLNLLRKKLLDENFKVYTHGNVPCNDGGLSVGQLMIAAHQKI